MPSLIQKAQELSTEDFTSLPIIDLTDATSPSLSKRKALALQIQHACLTAGFFYVKNSGVDESVVTKAFEQSKLFFDLPLEVKKTIDISMSDNFRGWMGLLSENTDSANAGDLHEAFNLGLDPSLLPTIPSLISSNSTYLSSGEQASSAKKEGQAVQEENGAELKHGENLWLDEKKWEGAETFKKTVLNYYTEILGLGYRLFPLLALALDLPEDFFADKTRNPAVIQRLLYYPPLQGKPADERQPGIGEHTDYEVFTVLKQDEVGGLEVKNLAGDWVKAEYVPGTFVINIGDQLARWTNDIFRSTRHRAVPPPAHTARYSMPAFFGCDHQVPLIPISTCVDDEHPSKYEVVTAGAYVQSRLEETYTVGEKA